MATIYSTAEVAAKLGVSPQRVRKLITTKRIRAIKVGKSLGVTEAELRRFIASPRKSRGPALKVAS